MPAARFHDSVNLQKSAHKQTGITGQAEQGFAQADLQSVQCRINPLREKQAAQAESSQTERHTGQPELKRVPALRGEQIQTAVAGQRISKLAGNRVGQQADPSRITAAPASSQKPRREVLVL